MNTGVPELPRLGDALHLPQLPPAAPAWNAHDLADLLAPDTLRTPAAVLIGLVPRPPGTQVLFTRRTESLRNHAGQVSFPGGRIEPGDADPVAAAVREAREEIGLEPGEVAPLGYLDPFETITGFHVYPVVARIAASYAPVLDPREVDELFEVPLTFLLDPGNALQVEAEYRGHLRRYYEFRYGPHRIWGATAAMLVNFRERIQGSS